MAFLFWRIVTGPTRTELLLLYAAPSRVNVTARRDEVRTLATSADIKQGIIDDAASGIAKATNDQGSVEAMSIKDRILADQYTSQKDAAANANRGLRFTRLRTPGAEPT